MYSREVMAGIAPRDSVTRYYYELWNRRQFDLIPQMLDPDFRFRGSLGMEVTGRAGFREYMETVRTAFPDFHNTIEEMIGDAESVAARLTYRGTHLGPLFGVPPTGRQVTYPGVAIFAFETGLVKSVWVLGDALSMWRQLGRIPPDFNS